MLAVKASDPGTTKADFKGKRLSSTKGSTSELSIKMNGSEPVTFQDTGSAFMAVQQNKSRRHGGQHHDDHQARQPVEDRGRAS